MSTIIKPRTPGRRFFLPPGYSLGLKAKGKTHEFRWTRVGVEVGAESPMPFKSGEEAAGAAWDDARLPRPARLSEAC